MRQYSFLFLHRSSHFIVPSSLLKNNCISMCKPTKSGNNKALIRVQKKTAAPSGSAGNGADTHTAAIRPKRASSVAKAAFSIALPIIAGLLHTQVFFYAVKTLVLSRTILLHHSDALIDLVKIKGQLQRLDICVFFAYSFDLICCYVFKVIPFSRCNSSRDIATHHLPILLLFLPLCVPCYYSMFYHLDPLSHNIFDYDIGAAGGDLFDTSPDHHAGDHHHDGIHFKVRWLYAVLVANGLGFISSLNEVFMCFQRAEMNLGGIRYFKDIPMMKEPSLSTSTLQYTSKRRIQIFTSRSMIGIELYFKLCIFCMFSLVSFWQCCQVDRASFDYVNVVHPELNVWGKIGMVYSSPVVLRGLLFRIFMFAMYPFMGWRTAKKIRMHHRHVDVLVEK